MHQSGWRTFCDSFASWRLGAFAFKELIVRRKFASNDVVQKTEIVRDFHPRAEASEYSQERYSGAL